MYVTQPTLHEFSPEIVHYKPRCTLVGLLPSFNEHLPLKLFNIYREDLKYVLHRNKFYEK
jgi:hypothetical protein